MKKGKLLKTQEVLNLEKGTEILYILPNTKEEIRTIVEKAWNGISVMNKNGSFMPISEDNQLKFEYEVYEWKEDVEAKQYKGWEILKMISEGDLKYKDKVLVDGDELYVSDTGTLRFSSDRREVYSSYFNADNTFIIVVAKPVSVTFLEAVKAYEEGKTITCNLNVDITEYTKPDCDIIMKDKDGFGLSSNEILRGVWYIK